MSREQFILAIAVILLVAFALGWFAHWLLHRFSRVASADLNSVEQLSKELHEAEELRDQALVYIEQRERELTTQLSQTEAELRAAMDGLRTARNEADELRAYIERQNQGGA